jgi:hypothetical protein
MFFFKTFLTSIGVLTPSYYMYSQYYTDNNQLAPIYQDPFITDEDYSYEILILIFPFMYFLFNFSFIGCVYRLYSLIKYLFNYSYHMKEDQKFKIILMKLDTVQDSIHEINDTMETIVKDISVLNK